MKDDAFVKSRKMVSPVIPAKAGIQEKQAVLDPGFRRGDGFEDFLQGRQRWKMLNDQCEMISWAGGSIAAFGFLTRSGEHAFLRKGL
jgi:hypothetical protein